MGKYKGIFKWDQLLFGDEEKVWMCFLVWFGHWLCQKGNLWNFGRKNKVLGGTYEKLTTCSQAGEVGLAPHW